MTSRENRDSTITANGGAVTANASAVTANVVKTVIRCAHPSTLRCSASAPPRSTRPPNPQRTSPSAFRPPGPCPQELPAAGHGDPAHGPQPMESSEASKPILAMKGGSWESPAQKSTRNCAQKMKTQYNYNQPKQGQSRPPLGYIQGHVIVRLSSIIKYTSPHQIYVFVRLK